MFYIFLHIYIRASCSRHSETPAIMTVRISTKSSGIQQMPAISNHFQSLQISLVSDVPSNLKRAPVLAAGTIPRVYRVSIKSRNPYISPVEAEPGGSVSTGNDSISVDQDTRALDVEGIDSRIHICRQLFSQSLLFIKSPENPYLLSFSTSLLYP